MGYIYASDIKTRTRLNPARAHALPAVAALLVATVVTAFVLVLDRAERERALQQQRAETLDRLSTVRARLESTVTSKIYLSRALETFVASHPDISREHFEDIARGLLRGQSGIVDFELARASVISHVYPRAGNEHALGFDILADPDAREGARRAIATRGLVFAGPVRLAQGGSGFIARNPVFLTRPGTEPGSGDYWGLAQVVIDRDTLFRQAGMLDPNADLRFCLRGKDTLGASGAMILGDEPICRESPVNLEVSLPNGSWQLAAVPRNGWQAAGNRWLHWGGGLLAVLSGLLAWFLVRSPVRLRQAVTSATGALSAAREELEARVEERTRQLADANRSLEGQIADRRQAEAAVRRQLHFTQTLIDAIPNPLFYKDRQGRYLGCNKAFEAAIGRHRQDIVGKTVYEVAPQNLADKYREMDDALWASPGTQVYEHPVACTDGTVRTILFNKAILADLDGDLNAMVGLMLDMTERKRAEERLAAAEAMFRGLVEQSLAGIYVIQDGRFVYVNPTLGAMMGYTQDELTAAPSMLQFIAPEDRERVGENIRRRLGGEADDLRYSLRVVRKDGSLTHFEVHGKAVEYNGRPAVIGMALDVSEQLQAAERLNYLAFYDVLTGLPNRTLFMDHLQLAMAGAKRHGTLMALLFLDLDRFKEINDTLGHHIGDLLLREVGRRLSACLREVDTLARLGGDEFAIIQTDLAGVEGAQVLAQKIIEAIARPFHLDGHEVFTSTSIGLTVYPVEDARPEELLKNADMAMYAAKSQGRNSFRFFSSAMNVDAHQRMNVQSGLRQALERDEFQLFYQPKINLKSGRIVGAEALLRWKHPDQGFIPPLQFIPVAEESGLIAPIGEHALRMACIQNKLWQKAGLPPLRISVNLSAVQFKRQNLLDTVIAALAEAGLAAEYLELEITESLLMQSGPETVEVLEQLRARGVRISIDDFGTGYSSLNYLKRLPVDVLKIDRSFIDDIPGDLDDVAITKAIISLGHHLNLQVIAEGVETLEQAAFLSANGCDEVQGYYFSRPLPVAEFDALLRSGRSFGL
jgi:diguanylate cyclase (GGDEF)-like protein/PAS domain S-box-containing protein